MLFVDSVHGVAPAVAAGRRPWLGKFNRADHALLFPRRARRSKRVALLPLTRQERLIGSLNFGSRERERFTAALGTDFLHHLAVIAAFALESAVNRARLVRSGFTDVLTGWHNRRYLQSRLHEELARCRRERTPLTCLMIDVDHFKSVNDRFGHLAGDEVLRQLAHCISAEVRGSDVSARYGGEEFVVLLPGTGVAAGFLLAERIRAAVARRTVRAAGAWRRVARHGIDRRRGAQPDARGARSQGRRRAPAGPRRRRAVRGEGRRPERGGPGRQQLSESHLGMPAFWNRSGGYERIDRNMDFIDEQGFRANVGIILTDGDGRVLIAGRRGRGGWQFPQGGIQPEETTEAAMFRELREEVGLAPSDVELVGSTEGWLRYRLPDRFIRREQTPLCIGQKQRWFLLQLTADAEPRAVRSEPGARVRSVPLGRLLAARQGGRLFQAARLRACAARARAARISERRSAAAADLVAAPLAAGLERAAARASMTRSNEQADLDLRARRVRRVRLLFI